jgi:hypothetical protein
MSSIISFSSDEAFAVMLSEHCRNRGVSRSLFIRQAVLNAIRGQASSLGGQVHVSPPKIRAKRQDGKCNPKLPRLCGICWPEEEE